MCNDDVLDERDNWTSEEYSRVTAVTVACSTASLLLGIAATAAVFHVTIKRRSTYTRRELVVYTHITSTP